MKYNYFKVYSVYIVIFEYIFLFFFFSLKYMYTANYDDLNDTIHAGTDPGFLRGGGGANLKLCEPNIGTYW